MKYYLKDVLTRLQKQSATLDQSAFLVDKPWVVSNSEEAFEKLIFKRDGILYLSSNGDVTEGKWEYLPEANSLLIDYGKDKKLYRHQYLDAAVLALKIDGPSKNDEDYFLLANENVIDDYDAKSYLERKCLNAESKLIDKNTNSSKSENAIEDELIRSIELIDGIEVQIVSEKTEFNSKIKALINQKVLSDGTYTLSNQQEAITVKSGIVTNFLKKFDYNELSVWQSGKSPEVGERVEGFSNGMMNVAINGTTFQFFIADGIIKSINEIDNSIIVLIIIGIAIFIVAYILSLLIS